MVVRFIGDHGRVALGYDLDARQVGQKIFQIHDSLDFWLVAVGQVDQGRGYAQLINFAAVGQVHRSEIHRL